MASVVAQRLSVILKTKFKGIKPLIFDELLSSKLPIKTKALVVAELSLKSVHLVPTCIHSIIVSSDRQNFIFTNLPLRQVLSDKCYHHLLLKIP